MIKHTYRDLELILEEDGKPFPTDFSPQDALNSNSVKITATKGGKTVVVATRFGYTVDGVMNKTLATPFTNLQRFLVTHGCVESKID